MSGLQNLLTILQQRLGFEYSLIQQLLENAKALSQDDQIFIDERSKELLN